MAKPIHNVGGQLEMVPANSSSAGAADAGKLAELDGAGRWDLSMMPVGVGADTSSIEVSENLLAGDFVNIAPTTGLVRKADASNGYEAHGFVLDAVTSGQNGLVYFEGQNTSITGKTPGATQFLSNVTAGESIETAPSTVGHYSQIVGVATSATAISFERARSIKLA